MQRHHSWFIPVVLCFISTVLFSSCFISSAKRHASSSVMEYLYPNDRNHIEKEAIPRLELPLDVGIAFVPGGELDSVTKMELMDRISEEFKSYDFVKSIELIPSDYLVEHGGFSNLDQIHTMYGIDVIALVSYDQVQHTDENLLSITYWTIVGAYIFNGQKNDTSTMMDTVVYDIKSRKMLFRAPGTSLIKGTATAINLKAQLREDARAGLDAAAEKMVINLNTQLNLFKEKVKNAQDIVIVHKSGYTGAGNAGGIYTGAFLLIIGCMAWLGRRTKA